VDVDLPVVITVGLSQETNTAGVGREGDDFSVEEEEEEEEEEEDSPPMASSSSPPGEEDVGGMVAKGVRVIGERPRVSFLRSVRAPDSALRRKEYKCPSPMPTNR
jgi:hypothetical protein